MTDLPRDTISEYLKRINAALALRDIPDNVAALEQLKKAMRLAPTDISVHLLLGLTYQELGQLEAAEESLRQAVKLAPDADEARQALGLLLVQRSKYAEAIELLRPLTEGDVHNAAVRQAYATALAHVGKRTEAVELLQVTHEHSREGTEVATQGLPPPLHNFEAPLDEVTFTILDVETTGLSPAYGDRVCEIALLQVRGDEELAAFCTLVDPGRPISPGAFAVNRITAELLRGAPRFSEIADQVLAFLQDTVLVAHNAPFDLGFLSAEMEMARRALPALPVVDTLALARACYNFYSNSLGAIARTLNLIGYPELHRAMGDARLTQQLLRYFLEDLRPRGVVTLEHLLRRQGGAAQVPRREGPPLPPQLAEAISGGRTLFLRYIDAGGRETERLVRPLQVTAQRGELYLVAYCYLREDQRAFRLDRIVEMKAAD
jgi:DNA polymerase III epsilon subunit family exonuclease